MTWRTLAACRHDKPDRWVWIPRKDDSDRRRAAVLQAICAGCPVRAECLADELAVMRKGVASLGIRGGTTPEERNRMIGRRRRAA